MSEEKGAFSFSGEYACRLDDKGRLFIPLKHREAMHERGTTKGLLNLSGGYFSEVPALRLFDSKSPLESAYLRNERPFLIKNFASRILIPREAREFTGIERDVIVSGILDSLYLFSPASLDALKQNDVELAKDFEKAMRGF